jgi:hypothetical protein
MSRWWAIFAIEIVRKSSGRQCLRAARFLISWPTTKTNRRRSCRMQHFVVSFALSAIFSSLQFFSSLYTEKDCTYISVCSLLSVCHIWLVSALGRSLVQRSPTKCHVSNWVWSWSLDNMEALSHKWLVAAWKQKSCNERMEYWFIKCLISKSL